MELMKRRVETRAHLPRRQRHVPEGALPCACALPAVRGQRLDPARSHQRPCREARAGYSSCVPRPDDSPSVCAQGRRCLLSRAY
ncbi:hypothetical protein ACHHYP_16973 [Achlya hypogyna]|uniref:Uncharacterized protein n=1 Tax=Achlya hypogyna TaxID=1202772 RepID=A0A1V9Y5J7_ACHHY|nr:hypothetical protein ACHHYP_16973 [Achlya hypogyna]